MRLLVAILVVSLRFRNFSSSSSYPDTCDSEVSFFRNHLLELLLIIRNPSSQSDSLDLSSVARNGSSSPCVCGQKLSKQEFDRFAFFFGVSNSLQGPDVCLEKREGMEKRMNSNVLALPEQKAKGSEECDRLAVAFGASNEETTREKGGSIHHHAPFPSVFLSFP